MTVTLKQANSFEYDVRATYNNSPSIGKFGIDCIINTMKFKFSRPFELKHHLYFVKGRTGSGKSTCMPVELFKFFDSHHDYNEMMKYKNKCIVNVVEPTVVLAKTIPAANQEFDDYLKLGYNTGYRTGSGNIDPTYPSKLVYMTTEIFRKMLLRRDENMGNIVIVDECHKLDISMVSLLKEIKDYIFNTTHLKFSDIPIFIFASATFDVDKFVSYYFINKSHCDSDEATKRNVNDIFEDGSMIAYIKGSQNYPTVEHFISSEFEKEISVNSNTFVKWILTDRIEESIKSKFTIKKKNELIPVRDILIFVHATSFIKLFNDEIIHSCKYPVFISDTARNDTEDVNKWRKENINKTRVLILPYSSGCKGFSSKLLDEGIDPDKEAQKNEIKIFITTNAIETGKTFDTWYQIFDNGLQFKTLINPLMYNPDLPSVTKCLIDKSSSIQRCGRVGRKANGIRFRLYTKETYDLMPDISLSDNIICGSLAYTYLSSKKLLEDKLDIIKDNDFIYQNSFDTCLISTKDLILSGYLSPWGTYIKDIRNPNNSTQKWISEAEYLYYTTKGSLQEILIDCRNSRKNMSSTMVNTKFKLDHFIPQTEYYDPIRHDIIFEARQEYINFLIGVCDTFLKIK